MNKILRLYSVILFLCVACFSGLSQIKVKSFVELDNPLDATTYFPKKDLNGRTCAIIKLFTTHRDFNIDNGSLGIVAIEYHTAEIWVYVPEKTRKLKITHSQYGHIADGDEDGYYWFPEGGVKSGRCYKMDIELPSLQPADDDKVQTGWLTLNTTPAGAEITIGGKSYGFTPKIIDNLLVGDYDVTLSKSGYESITRRVTISKNATTSLDETLAGAPQPVEVAQVIDTIAETPVQEPKPEQVQEPNKNVVDVVEDDKKKDDKKKDSKESMFKFGVEGHFDYSSMASFGKTSFGVGAMVRLGRINSLINVNLGVKYQSSSVSKDVSYDFFDYESYNSFKGSAKYKNNANEILIPAIVNFNLKNIVYVGVGYEHGFLIGQKESYTPQDTFDMDVYQAISEYNGEDITPVSFPSRSLVLQVGWLHKHYDVKLYYKHNLANSSKSPMTIGVGVGYYF